MWRADAIGDFCTHVKNILFRRVSWRFYKKLRQQNSATDGLWKINSYQPYRGLTTFLGSFLTIGTGFAFLSRKKLL
jgi:hypothetical protein